GGEKARRTRNDDPGTRVLDEAAVEERVHEEGDEDGPERQAERGIAASDRVDRASRARKEGEVGEEADDPELGGDRQRRRVRDEPRLRPGALRVLLARERLGAESDP